MPQIEVTFDIDANGIVNVSAKDKATGKEQQIRIQASGGLSDAEIEKMVKDAEVHASEDKKRKELVEAKNHAEGLMHTTQRSLSELGDKVAQSDKSTVEAAIADLKKALEGEDIADIQSKTNGLAQVAMKLGEAMYKNQQGAGRPAAGWAGRRRRRRQPASRRTIRWSMPISKRFATKTRKHRDRKPGTVGRSAFSLSMTPAMSRGLASEAWRIRNPARVRSMTIQRFDDMHGHGQT